MNDDAPYRYKLDISKLSDDIISDDGILIICEDIVNQLTKISESVSNSTSMDMETIDIISEELNDFVLCGFKYIINLCKSEHTNIRLRVDDSYRELLNGVLEELKLLSKMRVTLISGYQETLIDIMYL
jgi:hypothetical protein